MIIPLKQYQDQYGYTKLEHVTPKANKFRPQGHHFNKLGRGPLGDTAYQISKL